MVSMQRPRSPHTGEYGRAWRTGVRSLLNHRGLEEIVEAVNPEQVAVHLAGLRAGPGISVYPASLAPWSAEIGSVTFLAIGIPAGIVFVAGISQISQAQ